MQLRIEAATELRRLRAGLLQEAARRGGVVPAMSSKPLPGWMRQKISEPLRLPRLENRPWTYTVPKSLVGRRVQALKPSTPLIVGEASANRRHRAYTLVITHGGEVRLWSRQVPTSKRKLRR